MDFLGGREDAVLGKKTRDLYTLAKCSTSPSLGILEINGEKKDSNFNRNDQ
jgi:hypothetical protein